jgi:hypothetical protein
VDSVSALNGKIVSGGRVNAEKALIAALSSVPSDNDPMTDPVNDPGSDSDPPEETTSDGGGSGGGCFIDAVEP